MSRRILGSLALAALVAAGTTPAHAQGWLKKAVDKVKTKAVEHVDKGQGQAPAPAPPASSAASPAAGASGPGTGATQGGAAPAPAAATPPGQGAWLNYDFIPGDRVLFFDDFATDHVGDLPARLDVTDGNATIVEIAGKKYFRTVTGAQVVIALAQPLPQRFTIEVTFHRNGGNGMGLHFTMGHDNQHLALRCDQRAAAIDGDGPNGEKHSGDNATGIGDNDFQTCRYMIDSGYVKAYVNSQRVGQLNGLVFARPKTIALEVPNADSNGTLITDLRIAAGGKPLYDALVSSGRVSTHGILFATGSATIEGESTPTLTDITRMLASHPSLKLTIEGHTDNVGSAAANQTLSEQRAQAVAAYLEAHGVAAARLQTHGYGDSKPVAPNTTPEGRQQNRRVELVKM